MTCDEHERPPGGQAREARSMILGLASGVSAGAVAGRKVGFRADGRRSQSRLIPLCGTATVKGALGRVRRSPIFALIHRCSLVFTRFGEKMCEAARAMSRTGNQPHGRTTILSQRFPSIPRLFEFFFCDAASAVQLRRDPAVAGSPQLRDRQAGRQAGPATAKTRRSPRNTTGYPG